MLFRTKLKLNSRFKNSFLTPEPNHDIINQFEGQGSYSLVDRQYEKTLCFLKTKRVNAIKTCCYVAARHYAERIRKILFGEKPS